MIISFFFLYNLVISFLLLSQITKWSAQIWFIIFLTRINYTSWIAKILFLGLKILFYKNLFSTRLHRLKCICLDLKFIQVNLCKIEITVLSKLWINQVKYSFFFFCVLILNVWSETINQFSGVRFAYSL